MWNVCYEKYQILIFTQKYLFYRLWEFNQWSYFTEYPKLSQFLRAFSLKNNFKKLLSTQTNQELSCINGLRVISIVWVIIGHLTAWVDWTLISNWELILNIVYLCYNLFLFKGNSFELKNILSAPENQIILQAYYSVENFFFIRFKYELNA